MIPRPPTTHPRHHGDEWCGDYLFTVSAQTPSAARPSVAPVAEATDALPAVLGEAS